MGILLENDLCQETINRGDIFMAEYYFDNSLRIRPVLVVQNDIGNRYSPLLIVVPIVANQGNHRNLPINIPIDQYTMNITGLKDSLILVNVILTIDKNCIKNKIGHASKELMSEVEKGLIVSLGIQNILNN